MKKCQRFTGVLAAWLSASLTPILPAQAIPSAITTNAPALQEKARTSTFYGKINRSQAAAMLERIITEGQCRMVLAQVLGVDPRIIADVHADRIDIRFRTFDQYSRDPVQWSRLGSQMRDFNEKWQDVSGLSVVELSGDAFTNCWALQLSTESDASTLIPLVAQPSGYSRNDVLLLACILTGREQCADTFDRTIPPPPLTTNAPPEQPENPDEPTAVPSPTPLLPNMHQAAETLQQNTENHQLAMPSVAATPTLLDPRSTPIPNGDLRQKLQTLKRLHEEGLIDDQVYLEKQRLLLEQL